MTGLENSLLKAQIWHEITLTDNINYATISVSMKHYIQDSEKVKSMAPRLEGVFTVSDLSILLQTEGKPLYNRMDHLIKNNILQNTIRGYYIAAEFNPYVLAQKINPSSYISMECILAEELMIGTIPKYKISSIKLGRPRNYSFGDYNYTYNSICPDLFKGFKIINGIKKAIPEKALLDTLYFYNKGLSFMFNIFYDVEFSNLNKDVYLELLEAYMNPKFRKFAYDYFVSRY
jgi:hypothetical protein